MLNDEKIEILDVEASKNEMIDQKRVQKRSKLVPFFLVCVFLLIVIQIIVMKVQ